MSTTTTTTDSTTTTYPESVTLPKVGDCYRLPAFMVPQRDSESAVYLVTASEVRAWYGTLRPVFSVVTLDADGTPTGRTYTDPWKPNRKPLTKGSADTFALWPEGSVSQHTGDRVAVAKLTKGQRAVRAELLAADKAEAE